MLRKIFHIFLCSYLLFNCSCSRVSRAVDAFLNEAGTVQPTAKPSNNQEFKAQDVEEEPLAIDVAQAFFEEGKLKIKVYVSAKKGLDSADVAFLALGLREGEIVEQRVMRLSDAIKDEELLPGQNSIIWLSLYSPNLTEYQIHCSWGEDARVLLQQYAAAGPSGEIVDEAKKEGYEVKGKLARDHPDNQISSSGETLEEGKSKSAIALADKSIQQEEAALALLDVSVEETKDKCDHPPCDITFTIYGMILNTGSVTVSDVHFAVGLYWAEDNVEPVVPVDFVDLAPNEEAVSLGDLVISPGEKRKVRLSVDRKVPILPGGRFFPHLRMLSYAKKNG